MPISNFGYARNYNLSDLASTAQALQTLATPEGITFSNGTNVWRIRMEVDNNLTFSYSSDQGQTYTVKHVFTAA